MDEEEILELYGLDPDTRHQTQAAYQGVVAARDRDS